jgi:hypothetical protein
MKQSWLRSRRDQRVATTGPTRPPWHAIVGAAAIVVTVMVLAMLVGLKVATRPAWRASGRAGLTSCMRGHWSTRSVGRLHQAGHLARCAARLEPVRADYLELATVGLLVALLAGEVGLLLTRDRGTVGQRSLPVPSSPRAGEPSRPDVRRPAQPRTSNDQPAAGNAEHPSGPDRC